MRSQPPQDSISSSGSFVEVFLVSLKLGLTSFGGPIAHLAYFHQEFVVRRKWLPEGEYADLIALCQFLPGPASSQVNMAVGMIRVGWLGALAAWLGFTLPSALLMIAFAYGTDQLGDIQNAGWLKGLRLAAVAVIAQAVVSMAMKFCCKPVTVGIAFVGATILFIAWSPPLQLLVIAMGALTGGSFLRSGIERSSADDSPQIELPYGRKIGVTLLAAFALLFASLPLLKLVTNSSAVASFDAFYRAGSLVFGGGHVILPLLRSEVVTPGWINDSRFLAGYGAAQALPGPLFTFTAFLGTTMKTQPHGWIGGLWCMSAIFLPSVLLLFGVLPFWADLRKTVSAQAALQGANAAVVGLLISVLYNPVWKGSVHSPLELVLAVAALFLLVAWKLPPWLVVAAVALAGWIFLN